jgi:uridylate kinase
MIAWILLIVTTIALATASLFRPFFLSDEGNNFLKGFTEHEFLPVLGVIVTITLASAASLHLEINKLEDAVGEQFGEARAAIRLSAYSLIGALAAAGVLVMAKGTAEPTQTTTAFFNSGAILILFFNIAILADLTAAVFGIPPLRELRNQNDGQSAGSEGAG